jgi:hypothetical protein
MNQNPKGRPPRAVPFYHPLMKCDSGMLRQCQNKAIPLASMRNPPEDKAKLEKLDNQVKHLQKKAAEKSETHSRKQKGQQE